MIDLKTFDFTDLNNVEICINIKNIDHFHTFGGSGMTLVSFLNNKKYYSVTLNKIFYINKLRGNTIYKCYEYFIEI